MTPCNRTWRRSVRRGVIALFPALLAAPSAVAAPPLRVTLEYETPPTPAGCADEAEFRRRVTSRLGDDPFAADAALHVHVQASQSEGETEGRVKWQDASGQARGEQLFARKNRGCSQLLSELSFAVAVQIELLRAGEAPSANAADRPPEGPVSERTDKSAPSQTSAPPPARAPQDRRDTQDHAARDARRAAAGADANAHVPWSVAVGGGPAIDLDLAPTPAASARLFVAVRYGHLSMEVGAGSSLPTTDQRPDGTGFHEYTLASEVGLCGHADRFGLCGLGVLGAVFVRGFGVDQPAAPSGILARAGVRATVAQQLTARWSASLRADALVLLTPWTVYLNQTPVWTMPAFGSVLGVDLTARFP